MKTLNHGKPLLVKIGLCSLNNDPLSFDKNLERIMKSIKKCKETGCKIRVGAELEVTGYACNDHFNQYDTIMHSWEVIYDIIKSGITEDILCCFGAPIIHHGALYNTQIVVLDHKILGIRPKMIMADGDNYFESKWFSHWKAKKQVSEFKLPIIIQEITGQKQCPIGQFILNLNDTMVGFQICEQSWISHNPMIDQALDGAQIIINPSASYVERGKLSRKIQMLKQFTQRHGGCYVYTNLKGSVGERTYFDGGCVFTQNGKVKAISELNTLDDIIVTEAVANLTLVRTFRLSKKSFGKGSHGVNRIPTIKVDFKVANWDKCINQSPKEQAQLQKLLAVYYHSNVSWQPSLFLWDYLRKSNGGGFFLALSGGLDSCSVALIVYNMCFILWKQITERKNSQVLADLRKVVDNAQYNPESAGDICNKILFTAYMGTSNSSNQTKVRAELIAKTINCHHRYFNFDNIYKSSQEISEKSLGISINFEKQGGTWRQDLALQNVQARSRMLLSYMFAQLQLEVPKRKGFLLVLASGNLDECLRGYFTKYDCSSADINPIGSFSKQSLRTFLKWNFSQHSFDFINQILEASPSAQLRPLVEGQIVQTDQQDMGLTYQELHRFGKFRRIDKLGPVSMFQTFYQMQVYPNAKILAQKVKKFFKYYGINRHKMSVLTPAFHYDPESCDDNRYDMRPIYYATNWKYQFDTIDERVKQILGSEGQKQKQLK